MEYIRVGGDTALDDCQIAWTDPARTAEMIGTGHARIIEYDVTIITLRPSGRRER
jgi:hypothetical protein